MMWGGMGRPGGRETRKTSTETEVKIPLLQAGLVIAAGLVCTAVIQLLATSAALRILSVAPWARGILSMGLRCLWPLLGAASFIAGAWSLFTSMIINVHDQSWPAPYAARDPDLGPTAPGWARILSGWRDPPATPASNVPLTQYDYRVEGDLLVGNGKTATNPRPNLALGEWQRLARMFERGQCSVSVRDLQNAGFSKGPEGAARRVNRVLTQEWPTLTEPGERGKPYAIPEFAAWVVARGYAQDLPIEIMEV